MLFYRTVFVCPLCEEEHALYKDAEECVYEHLRHGLVLGYRLDIYAKDEIMRDVRVKMYKVNLEGLPEEVVFEGFVADLEE